VRCIRIFVMAATMIVASVLVPVPRVAGTAAPESAVSVPAPPEPMVVPDGTPEDLAAGLSDALVGADASIDPAAFLRVVQESGFTVPGVAPHGSGGPSIPWWWVWTLTRADTQERLTVAEIAQAVAASS
jgi:hypothetical protein